MSMEALWASGGILFLLLVTGLAIGFFDRDRFRPGWLLVAILLVFVNDALLTGVYGNLPDLLPSAQWNWQGKLTALTATLAIAASPAIGWRNIGLTFVQRQGSLKTALPVSAAYILFFLLLAVAFPSGPASEETIAFQLSMPSLEEEIFYRGLLLFVLDRAFTGRVAFLGVHWGWGALISSALFGLAHSISYSEGAFHFEAAIMALTAIPSLLGVWLRLRTGSLLLPILLHTIGNSASFLV